MSKHGVVALRMRFRDGGVELTTLGQSNRGTRYRIEDLSLDSLPADKAARAAKLKQGIDQLIPSLAKSV